MKDPKWLDLSRIKHEKTDIELKREKNLINIYSGGELKRSIEIIEKKIECNNCGHSQEEYKIILKEDEKEIKKMKGKKDSDREYGLACTLLNLEEDKTYSMLKITEQGREQIRKFVLKIHGKEYEKHKEEYRIQTAGYALVDGESLKCYLREIADELFEGLV